MRERQGEPQAITLVDLSAVKSASNGIPSLACKKLADFLHRLIYCVGRIYSPSRSIVDVIQLVTHKRKELVRITTFAASRLKLTPCFKTVKCSSTYKSTRSLGQSVVLLEGQFSNLLT